MEDNDTFVVADSHQMVRAIHQTPDGTWLVGITGPDFESLQDRADNPPTPGYVGPLLALVMVLGLMITSLFKQRDEALAKARGRRRG